MKFRGARLISLSLVAVACRVAVVVDGEQVRHGALQAQVAVQHIHACAALPATCRDGWTQLAMLPPAAGLNKHTAGLLSPKHSPIEPLTGCLFRLPPLSVYKPVAERDFAIAESISRWITRNTSQVRR